jgi:hypothetical protein
MRNAIRKATVGALIAFAQAGTAAQAGEFVLYEFWQPYAQRIEGITRDAGDAKAANAAIHTVDPWPRYSARRRIPASGERMAGAAERHRDVRKLPLTPPPIAPTAIGTSGLSGGTTPTSAAPPASGSASR